MYSKSILIFSLLITLSLGLLSCGGGGDGSDSGDPVTAIGQFKLGVNVEGLEYVSGRHSGMTDADGYFTYVVGETVTFSFAAITLGQTIGKRIITPIDLVENGSVENNAPTYDAVINRTRFLMLLDKDRNEFNGVEITEATREKAGVMDGNWANDDTNFPDGFLDTNTSTFTSLMENTGGAIDQLGTSHHLPNVNFARGSLTAITIDCVNTGIYLGTFTGDDHGRIGILNFANFVNAMAYSDTFTQTYHIFYTSPKISYDQNAAFTGASDSIENIVLDGNFTSVNVLEGTWEDTDDNRTGTFTVERVGGDWEADYRIAGAINETPINRDGTTNKHRGLVDLKIDATTHAVDGSLYWLGGAGDNWVKIPIVTTTSTYDGSSLTATFADGTVITDNDLTLGVTTGLGLATWNNLRNNSRGVVATSHGCLLNN